MVPTSPPPSIYIIQHSNCSFRPPLDACLEGTRYLYLKGLKHTVFSRVEIFQLASTFANIISATLIRHQQNIFFLTCTNTIEAQRIREIFQTLSKTIESHAPPTECHPLNNQRIISTLTPEVVHTIQKITSIEFAEKILSHVSMPLLNACTYVSSTQFLPKSIVQCDDKNKGNYSIPIDIFSCVSFDDPCLYNDKLSFIKKLNTVHWKKDSFRLSECFFGSSLELNTTKHCIYYPFHEFFPDYVLKQTNRIWETAQLNQPSFEHDFTPTVNQASVILITKKKPTYLSQDNSEFFAPMISLYSLGVSTNIFFWNPTTAQHFGIQLEANHMLTIVGPERFMWAMCGTLSTTSESTTGYLIIMRYVQNCKEVSHSPIRQIFNIQLNHKIESQQINTPSDQSCPRVCPKILDTLKNNDNPLNPTLSDTHCTSFLNEYVHNVYDRIACHFSHTRYRPWPKIQLFLQSLPIGAIVLDTGCGNGKYASCNPDIYWIGSDRSQNLTTCCIERNYHLFNKNEQTIIQDKQIDERPCYFRPEVYVDDCTRMSARSNSADACISIAVIHHLPTEEKRLKAIEEMVRCVRPGGHILIYVWAIEQKSGTVGSRKFDSQDIFVPWHLQKHLDTDTSSSSYSIITKEASLSHKDVSSDQESNTLTLHRYYHVFREAEIRDLCNQVNSATITNMYFDSNNWAVLMQKN